MSEKSACYVPYGAYELKAKYQLNLMLAMLTVIIFLSALFAVGWSFFNSPGTVALVPLTPIIRGRPSSPESIIIVPEKPTGVGGGAPTLVDKGGIPTPVADEALNSDVLIAAPDDLARLGNPFDVGGDGAQGNSDDGMFAFLDTTTDYLPSPDEIIFFESPPVMVNQVVPNYPRFEKMAGNTGIVIVKALVNVEGIVVDVLVYKSSGRIALDEAAIEAAYKTPYKPAIQNGRPIAVWVSYSVVFKLDQ